MQHNKIILLMGQSGVGKSSVADCLCRKYQMAEVKSYTTREKRPGNDNTHIFLSEQEFDKIPVQDIVAYTEFAGHRYCATRQQVDDSDIYVVDPDGALKFLYMYHGDKVPYLVYLTATFHTRWQRMLNRGDSFAQTEFRILSDRDKFKSIELCPVALRIATDNLTVPEVAECIMQNLQMRTLQAGLREQAG
jgi:guanylate kinase